VITNSDTKPSTTEKHACKPFTLQDNTQDLLVLTCDKVVNASGDLVDEEKDKLKEVFRRGWSKMTQEEQFQMTDVFLTHTINKDFIAMIDDNSDTLPENLKILSAKELFRVLCAVV
jgi:hypothetical protein